MAMTICHVCSHVRSLSSPLQNGLCYVDGDTADFVWFMRFLPLSMRTIGERATQPLFSVSDRNAPRISALACRPLLGAAGRIDPGDRGGQFGVQLVKMHDAQVYRGAATHRIRR